MAVDSAGCHYATLRSLNQLSPPASWPIRSGLPLSRLPRPVAAVRPIASRCKQREMAGDELAGVGMGPERRLLPGADVLSQGTPEAEPAA